MYLNAFNHDKVFEAIKALQLSDNTLTINESYMSLKKATRERWLLLHCSEIDHELTLYQYIAANPIQNNRVNPAIFYCPAEFIKIILKQ